MNKYTAILWICILIFLVLPWLSATILAWVYAGGYEKQSGGQEGDPAPGEVIAAIQTSSSIVYIIFILGALVLIGIVGRPDDNCTYFCLVVGIPVFVVVPIVAGSVLLVSAINNKSSVGNSIGIAAAVLCFCHTLPCCCILVCGLACGTRGRGRRSRYPMPIAYIPILGEWKQKEDTWEKMKGRREFTDDYPTDSPPGPPPSYKTTKYNNAENGEAISSSRRSSASSVSYYDGRRKSLMSVTSENRRRSSVGSLSIIKEDSRLDSTALEGHRRTSAVSDDVFKPGEGNSRKRFSLSTILNPRRKSSANSQESQEDKPVGRRLRRYSEPAIKIGVTTGNSSHSDYCGSSTSGSNSRKSSVADPTVKELYAVHRYGRKVSSSSVQGKMANIPAPQEGGKRSMFSKMRRKSDTTCTV